MKKQFLMMAGLVAFTVSALGQGQVTFGNNSSTLITYAGHGTPVLPETTLFQLFAGATPDSLSPLLPIVGTSSFAGRIANAVMNINAVAPGETAYFQIRAWQNGYTYEDAVRDGIWAGSSVVFSSPTSGPAMPFPTTPVSLAGQYPGFFVVLPEPSTWTLLALGGLFFLFVSRARVRSGNAAACREKPNH